LERQRNQPPPKPFPYQEETEEKFSLSLLGKKIHYPERKVLKPGEGKILRIAAGMAVLAPQRGKTDEKSPPSRSPPKAPALVVLGRRGLPSVEKRNPRKKKNPPWKHTLRMKSAAPMKEGRAELHCPRKQAARGRGGGKILHRETPITENRRTGKDVDFERQMASSKVDLSTWKKLERNLSKLYRKGSDEERQGSLITQQGKGGKKGRGSALLAQERPIISNAGRLLRRREKKMVIKKKKRGGKKKKKKKNSPRSDARKVVSSLRRRNRFEKERRSLAD